MSDATWPTDLVPVSCEFFLQFNTTKFSSPITRGSQVLRRQGEAWRCAIKTRPLLRAETQAMDARLAKLKGAFGTIKLYDFSRPEPLGSNLTQSELPNTRFEDSGSPLVRTEFSDGTEFSGGDDVVQVWGAHLFGATQVFTRQWLPSTDGLLLAGDYVGIDERLYILTEDVNSDASGRATMSIAPPLKAQVASLTEVVRVRPTANFRLIDDMQPNRDAGFLTEFHLSFEEAQ